MEKKDLVEKQDKSEAAAREHSEKLTQAESELTLVKCE